MMQLITWAASHSDQIMGAITSIVTGASALAALTPTPKEGTTLALLYKVIDFLALNIGKAKDTGKQEIVEKVVQEVAQPVQQSVVEAVEKATEIKK